jgi:cyclic pyranopterin phosphate synthase
VLERGVNDDDIIPLAKFARERGFHLRFIEYMDVGNSNNWENSKVVSKREILKTINDHFPLEAYGSSRGHAPAVDYRYTDGKGVVGVIASMVTIVRAARGRTNG